MTDHLLWLDLETTGLDETKDAIIEIGCILTTPNLSDVGCYQAVVRPTDEAVGRMMRTPVVLEMHEANGLYDALMLEDLPHREVVAKEIVDWLNVMAPGPVVLAGSGVSHFDRRFLKAQMPALDRRLRHWCIDVGVLRRAYFLWGDPQVAEVLASGGPDTTKTHRALEDAAVHLAEARRWQNFIIAADGDEVGDRTLLRNVR